MTGALTFGRVLIVRLTSNAHVEIQASGSRVTGIEVVAGDDASIHGEPPESLGPGQRLIVAGISRTLPAVRRRTVTVSWDGESARETETVEWPPPPS